MYLQDLDVSGGHIQTKGEKGQPPLPSPTQEGSIHTTVATQRRTRQIAEMKIILLLDEDVDPAKS